MNGNCNDCDWYRENRCLRAEKGFSTMVDPICLAKVQIILLRDLCDMFYDYLENDAGGDPLPPVA